MGNCKNCNTTLQGKYCHNCKQRIITGYELKYFLNNLLTLVDIQKRFFRTIFYVLFWPRTLINDYRNGITVKYINPVTTFLVLEGFFLLLPHLKFLGLPMQHSGKIESFLEFGIPVIISSILVGYIPYMKLKPLEMITINLYIGSGLVFLLNLEFIGNAILWQLNINDIDISYYLFVTAGSYLLYYYLVVFGIHIHKLLTNLIVFVSIIVACFMVLEKIDERPINSSISNQIPDWSKDVLNYGSIDLSHYSLNNSIENACLKHDLNEDDYRDIILVLTSTTKENLLLYCEYLKGDYQLLNFTDICLPHQEILKLTPKTNELNITFTDSTNYTIALTPRGLIMK